MRQLKYRDIVLKDLTVAIRDKKTLGTTILMPIVLITILSFALTSSFHDFASVEQINIAVVKNYNMENEVDSLMKKLSSGELGFKTSEEDLQDIKTLVDKINIDKMFFDEFLENKEIKKIVKYKILDEKTAMNELEKEKISAVIVLPKDFASDMYINYLTPFRNEVNIKVIGHPNRNISSQIVEEIVNGFANVINTTIIGKNLFIQASMEEGLGKEAFANIDEIVENLTNNLKKYKVQIDYEDLNERKPMTSASYYSFSMATMFILFAAGYGSKLLLEEKDNKTYDRMTVGGVEKRKMVVGKIFTVFFYTMIQLLVLVVYSSIVLKVNWGNTFLVFLICLTSSFCIAGLSILLSSIVYLTGNYNIGNLFETAVVQIMAVLGGSFFPIEVMPKTVQKLSNFTINGLALKSYIRVYFGHGIVEIYKNLVFLTIIGIVFMTIAIYLLKKEERGEFRDKYHKTKAYGNA